jgi:hypothetical protein
MSQDSYDPQEPAHTAHEHALAAGHVHRSPVDPARYAHIPGWGADRDKKNRPGVPMERTPPRLEGVHWDMPPQQESDVEVLHSTERAGLTPVFGTTLPPRGLSGMLRRFGFGYSENDLRRWLILLAADRVDMVEGLLADVGTGHLPRVYSEMGGRAELRHNPAGAARKAATLAVLAGAAYWIWSSRRRRRR